MDDNLIWCAYERNSFYYSKCKDITTCPTKYYDRCYCHYNAFVHPIIIADCGFLSGDIKPSINKKCYIGFGETCSICMEPIMTKKSAWLTPCSHSFHRKCLIENHRYRQIHNMTIEYSNEIPCPVCREGHIECCIGVGTLNKYHGENKNGLDRLENFWQNMDIDQYLLCYKCNKGLGMNKLCNNCEYYRDTGRI